MTTKFYPKLATYLQQSQASFGQIPAKRRTRLEEIARYVQRNRHSNGVARLTFICTHNSRRSHMAQIWAFTAASWYDLPDVAAFSGGTETTAFDPRAVAALRRAGFEIVRVKAGANPVYHVRYGETGPTVEAFSRLYDARPNPTEEFCAVMTCSDADANCPVIHGADLRVATPYHDPKSHDGTDQEAEKYDERCREIGTEMLYMLSVVPE